MSNSFTEIDIDYSQAACGKVDNPDMFFPDGKENHWELVAAAKELCGACPVVLACFMHGVKHEKIGIWGGRTPSELRSYRRIYNIAVEPLDIETPDFSRR